MSGFVRNCQTIFQSNCCCFSLARSCLTLFDPMDCSPPGFPVLHFLLEFSQTHVHWVADAIQSSHSLLPPLSPALSLSKHQGLFQWAGFACTSRSSQFMYCWKLAWRFSALITLLTCEMRAVFSSLNIVWHCPFLGLEWKLYHLIFLPAMS